MDYNHIRLSSKYAIMLQFSGVLARIREDYPNVYRRDPNSRKSKSTGWAALILSLADGKTDDESLNRIMNSNLYNVFMGLEKKSTEYFEFLEKHPIND